MKAQLHIQVADRNGCSYLKKAFFTTPFKVANITEDKNGKQLAFNADEFIAGNIGW